MARYNYKKPNYTSYAIVLIAGLIVGFALTASSFYEEPEAVTETSMTMTHAEISLVAVDENGAGVSTPLTVDVIPGDGKVLTDIDKLLFWVDTQYSIQTARDVARNITGVDTNKYDIIYSISTDATLVGGPSAGAALTLATIAALENKTLSKNIIITGTVEPDGSIGQVGGVLEKAQAVSDIGVDIFLVPPGQGEQTYLTPKETCTRRSGFIFCETTYEQTTINIGKDAGVSVIEVGTITEAMDYFDL